MGIPEVTFAGRRVQALKKCRGRASGAELRLNCERASRPGKTPGLCRQVRSFQRCQTYCTRLLLIMAWGGKIELGRDDHLRLLLDRDADGRHRLILAARRRLDVDRCLGLSPRSPGLHRRRGDGQ